MIDKFSNLKALLFGAELDKVRFEKNSYYFFLQKVNLDYMMGLDKDRLLYNYRRIAGLDTKGAQSYEGWISVKSGGSGQFEAHYITALAKSIGTMPDYRFHGESAFERLSYLLSALEECQDAFAERHPDNAGYIGAIGTSVFDALEVIGQGQNSIASDGAFVWVPWYFYHKNLEALLDVFFYVSDNHLRRIAFKMLTKATDWVYRRMSVISDSVRANVLKTEYGGMAEVLYQIYGITHRQEYLQTARYFEEKPFLAKIAHGEDALTGLHANTTIPKFLGCAAAYEATGETFYKTVCERAFDMIQTRTYANGSTSRAEFWQEAGKLEVSPESSETCCSYNMLKLSDYLFRWTRNKKYADYFENVYTNHILASMAPDTGLKTYLTNTAFGRYKIYHSVDKSFWCCACTGMESFAKLPYGIYYEGNNCVFINMFYPSEFHYNEHFTIVQSGDFFTEQKTILSVRGSGFLKLLLRLPKWANRGATLKLNGKEYSTRYEKGYFEIEREWKDGDIVEYALPFSFRLKPLKGNQKYKAIIYGPLLLVADLGNDDVHDVQESQLSFGLPYCGEHSDTIVLKKCDSLDESIKIIQRACGLTVVLSTLNQGELCFLPFNRLFHSRYGMYFKFIYKEN